MPRLVEDGHKVVCCVRDKNKFHPEKSLKDKIDIIENDLTDRDSLQNIPLDIDVAYYLVHSMSATRDFEGPEMLSARNFRDAVQNTCVRQVVYLSGIVNAESLSKHLNSRMNVEKELSLGHFHLTTLRAGIIIGSGSASFEIIRDLVEKLPVMVAPRWLETKCQPIAISDVLKSLTAALNHQDTFGNSFDIGGPDVLSYKDMLLGYAKVRKLKRFIYTVPVMTPRISSYWLYFITSTSYNLAVSLVESMKTEVVASHNDIWEILGLSPISYEEAIERAFEKMAQNAIVSSWKDSTVSGILEYKISDFIKVPEYGCFRDERTFTVSNEHECIEKIWKIGGQTGWYYGDFLWMLRGFLDKLVGGVGLRRGRTDPVRISAGDTLDFWRVIYADKNEKRLLLFAEMKLPGEAWLEFKITDGQLIQTATFRPKGLLGRLYWYSVMPFHCFIFNGLIQKLAD